MGSKDITALFNKFAGREVQYIPSGLAAAPDPTIVEMYKVADANGLKLRVLFPGSNGIDNKEMNRVNAHVEKTPDGKYHIAKFTVG